MRARAMWIAVAVSGRSLLVDPRAQNEYDLRDAGRQQPEDGGARDGGADAGPSIPATPLLRFPWNGYMTGSVHTGALPPERNALRPRFVWEPSEGAERYELQLTAACEAQTRETCTFDGAIEGVATETEWRPDEPLPVSMTPRGRPPLRLARPRLQRGRLLPVVAGPLPRRRETAQRLQRRRLRRRDRRRPR